MRRLILSLILLFGAACQSQVEPILAPTLIPFPTTTPGYTLYGVLPTQSRQINSQATVAAVVAIQATSTPDTSICPPISDLAELSNELPDDLNEEILRYLAAGGNIDELESTMRDDWDVLPEDGFVRGDLDLTGEGTPEIMLGYISPDGGGTLTILGCQNRRYTQYYQLITDEAPVPELLSIGDINRNAYIDLMFIYQVCQDDDCRNATELITWQPELGRFVNLLNQPIFSYDEPQLSDIDSDQVSEIVIPLEYIGNITTGPLRTGVNIYDWDGSVYVLSIFELEPPAYQIQVIQEGDRRFRQGEYTQAVLLYQQALSDESLDNWLRNEEPILQSYTLYRLLLTRAANNNTEELAAVYQRITELFPIESETAPPIYVEMSRVFWDTFILDSSLNNACNAVQDFITLNGDALTLINRYGTRNLSYTANHLCPF